MKGTTVAVVLSVIAICISLIQPMYNLFSSLNRTEAGSPMLEIDNIQLEDHDTIIALHNNGTASAHNIQVELTWYGPALFSSSQTVPELQSSGIKSYFVMYMPIGMYDLRYGGSNETQYNIVLYVGWNERPYPMLFNYSFSDIIRIYF